MHPKQMACGQLLAGDVAKLEAGAGWYNWQYPPRWRDAESAETFTPMARRAGWNPGAVKRWAAQHPGRTWLIGNEPSLPDQDGLGDARSTGRFYALAIQHVLQADPTATFIVGGYMLHDQAHPAYPRCGWDGEQGTGPTYWDTVWALMRSRLGRRRFERIIGYHVHFYYRSYQDRGITYRAERLKELITEFRVWLSRRDKRAQVWLTEFGALHWSPNDTVGPYMAESLAWLRETPLVDRYAWFIGRTRDYAGYRLLDQHGRLTRLGEIYVE